jgi:hypothetical protein
MISSRCASKDRDLLVEVPYVDVIGDAGYAEGRSAGFSYMGTPQCPQRFAASRVIGFSCLERQIYHLCYYGASESILKRCACCACCPVKRWWYDQTIGLLDSLGSTG